MSESLGDFLLEKREENKDEMETGIKQKYIGKWGEKFAYNYLKKLFERNNIRNDIVPHKYDKDDFDLEIYINGRRYKIEVKFSTAKNEPNFDHIHFKNKFDYLFLIWCPSDDKNYFAILTKDEAKNIATPYNTNREEDNWVIQTTEIFEETNTNFLNRLSMFLELNEELEDLDDEEKLELLEDVKDEIMKNPDAEKNDFSGEVYQKWTYEYLTNYTDDVEPKEYGDEYDIKYKGKHIEVKYSALIDGGTFKFFQFEAIKPDLFDFIFLIGFDEKENKFYFSIKTSDELVEIKRETTGSDNFYSQNGFKLNVGKHSKLNFVNDFNFADFDTYIETH